MDSCLAEGCGSPHCPFRSPPLLSPPRAIGPWKEVRMGITRRTVLGSALAGGTLVAAARYLPAVAASPPGDVVGRITVGYQGWFACAGDGAPINGWWHWSADWRRPPSPSNKGTLRAWPDLRGYTPGFLT